MDFPRTAQYLSAALHSSAHRLTPLALLALHCLIPVMRSTAPKNFPAQMNYLSRMNFLFHLSFLLRMNFLFHLSFLLRMNFLPHLSFLLRMNFLPHLSFLLRMNFLPHLSFLLRMNFLPHLSFLLQMNSPLALPSPDPILDPSLDQIAWIKTVLPVLSSAICLTV